MKQFEKRGFLSLNYRTGLKRLTENGEALTQLLLGLMETGWQLQYELEVDRSNLEKIHSVTLYARIINSVQASHLLAVYGLGPQSSNQCRVALECLFQLAALNKNKAIFSRLMRSNLQDQLSYIENVMQHMSQRKDAAADRLRDLEQEIKKLKDRITLLQEKQIEQMSQVKAIAKEADMLSWYDLLYGRLSCDTHPTLVSLQEHLHISDGSELSHFTNEPNFENFLSNTYCCIRVLCRAIQEIYIAVDEHPSEVLDQYIKKLDELGFDGLIFQVPWRDS